MLTAVILTKNEEKNIGRCLKSLNFCDEIILVDDYSTDSTCQVGQRFGTTIYKRALNGDFSAQRNFALEKARGEWILFVDSDEQVSTELASEIKNVLHAKSDIFAYYLRRRDYFWGQELKYGEIMRARNQGIIRLIKKGSGQWRGKVHEEIASSYKVKGLRGFINHFPHQNLMEFIKSINFYSTIRAKELHSAGTKPSVLILVTCPLFKFILNYFLKLGFLDGPAGFAYAFIMSFHSFLARAKLMQYSDFS